MPSYEKLSDQTTASTIVATDSLWGVQSSATVVMSAAQVRTFARGGAGIADTVQITGEYQLTEDNELDYSASFTDGMSAQTITFTELPADTVSIHAFIQLREDATGDPRFQWKRSSGATEQWVHRGKYADGGDNRLALFEWLATENNTIYGAEMQADITQNFKIIGYKTGA